MEQIAGDQINAFADDREGPVALHLRQPLTPVEGPGSVQSFRRPMRAAR